MSLTDTNILLRIVAEDSPEYRLIRACLQRLRRNGTKLFYTSQNLAEFWNVCTRPARQNGLGLSIAETNRRAGIIESLFSLAPDNDLVHYEWRRIVLQYEVSGARVHDARLVAAMRVHNIPSILTYNVKDFRRYPDIRVITPEEVIAAS